MDEQRGVAMMIERFLESPAFGVVGASANRAKYGNKILRCFLQHGRRAVPVHPSEPQVEGQRAVAAVGELPESVQALSIITPPAVTEQIVEAAIARGIKSVWMQPGAESPKAIARAAEAGIECIADGSCLLVVLGYRDC